MTYERREEIFSKEVLTISDIQELFDISASEASRKIKEIKRCGGDRIKIQGRLHIQDYFDYYNITDLERYKTRDDCKCTASSAATEFLSGERRSINFAVQH